MFLLHLSIFVKGFLIIQIVSKGYQGVVLMFAWTYVLMTANWVIIYDWYNVGFGMQLWGNNN